MLTLSFMILIGLTVAWLIHSKNKNDEGFQNVESTEDPRDLPWIASLSVADHKAREGQVYTVLRTEPGPENTTLVFVPKSCESGMAHTRPGDRIVLPDGIQQKESTIAHELVHIRQRRDKSAWMRFYTQSWGFSFSSSPPLEMPKTIVALRRSNPDTFDSPWVCWKSRFWPVCIYESAISPDLRNAHTIWWDSWRNEVLKTPPAEWSAFFGSPSQDEHPHEIAATISSESEAGRRLVVFINSRY